MIILGYEFWDYNFIIQWNNNYGNWLILFALWMNLNTLVFYDKNSPSIWDCAHVEYVTYLLLNVLPHVNISIGIMITRGIPEMSYDRWTLYS